MTVKAGISVSDGNLIVMGTKTLSDVHGNIFLTPARGSEMTSAAFIGVRSERGGSRNVFPIGKLLDLRFMCTFRFKMWWMTQRMGSLGRDIPFETQFLIVEASDGSHFGEGSDGGMGQSAVYVVFLPILEGAFRAVLQGNINDELEICLESGDPAVEAFEGNHLVLVAGGSDPFEVITGAIKIVEKQLQTFSHLEGKKMPDMLNWFGWCTWDAFYTDVSAEGVLQGLESFAKGGIHPKFIIIDDGWQSVAMDPSGIASEADNAANFANRLTHIKENHKFQKHAREGHRGEDPANGLAHIVTQVKDEHQVKYVFVWHTISGYWGGISQGVPGMEHYDSKMQYPVSSPGIQSNEHCDCLSSITKNGLGLVNPEKVYGFYNELHSYLAAARIDGVKVDVAHLPRVATFGWGGDSVVYAHIGGELTYLPKNASLPITLKSREYQVFTVVPVKQLRDGVSFAPVGLTKMFNSGGAIKELSYETTKNAAVDIKVRGCGVFGAYASVSPVKVTVGSEVVEFTYDEGHGLLTFSLGMPQQDSYMWDVAIEF